VTTSAVLATEERSQLRSSVRRILAERSDPRSALSEDGANVDDRLWQLLAVDMGLTSLLAPDTRPAVADLGVVFEELGAALAPVPMFSTMALVGSVLVTAGSTDATDELRARLATGGEAGTVVLSDIADPWRLDGHSATCHDDAMPTVTGEAAFVVEGAAADVFVVPVRRGSGLALLSVDAGSEGLTLRPRETLDLTRGIAHVTFERTHATVLTDAPETAAGLRFGLDLAIILLAAEQVGLSQHRLDAAVEYAKSRIQFGRPIGSFQAVKHRLVDLLLEIELARSALHYALDAAQHRLDAGSEAADEDLRLPASIARSMCSDAAKLVTSETLHVFGGIGFTWEHDAHLYFRRARADALLFGSPAWHRRRAATSLGIGR